MTSYFSGFGDFLTDKQHEALQAACDILVDESFEDLRTIEESGSFTNTRMLIYLPKRYSHKYDVLFAKKFMVTIIVVIWKLTQPNWMRLGCIAEELAFLALIQQAQVQLDLEGEDPDELEDFKGMILGDMDIEYLFDPQYDGIDESEVGALLGIESLAFGDWFRPFQDDSPVHPFTSIEE
jgi:hypothetical protein